MNKFEDLVKELAPVKEDKPKTYTAEVSHTDDEGIVWVRLPGAEQDTPTASTSSEVKMGDTVTVEWRNNKLYIAGNYTNPSAGVTRVAKAEQTAEKAVSDAETARAAADSAQETANDAIAIAGDTDQHFWFTETGTDTGAHITEATQEDFLADPTNGGGNLLARSNGIAVRDGLTELATFAANGARIGQNGQSRLEMDFHSMQLKDKEGNTYFHVSDLRDASGEFENSEEIIAQSTNDRFTVSYSPVISISVLDVNSEDWLPHIVSFSNNLIVLDTQFTVNSVIDITYKTTSTSAKAYTMGVRKEGSYIGALSVCEGKENVASGYASHAEGYSAEATDSYSHAEGYDTNAYGRGAHAEGCYTNAVSRLNSPTAMGIHAEGWRTTASDYAAHAEGYYTTASDWAAHAEGYQTTASGESAHAQNYHTTAGYDHQTAIGKYNNNKQNSAFEIGNGSLGDNSNAFEVDWNGNTKAAGTITVGGHYSPIGTKVTGTRESAAGTATTSYTTAAHINLTAGTWLITGFNAFNGGTAGRRAILITGTSTATWDAAEGSASGYAAASMHIALSTSLIVTPTGNATYYLRIKSASQVDSPEGNLTAVRIA